MNRLFSRFSTSPRRKKRNGRKVQRRYPDLLPRIVLASVVVLVVAGLYLMLTLKRAGLVEFSLPDLHVGDIARQREIALFDFSVPKPLDQLQEEQARASRDVLPIFNFDRNAFQNTVAEVDTLLAIVGRIPSSSPPDSVRRATEERVSGKLTYPEIASLKRVIDRHDTEFGDELGQVLNSGFAFLAGHYIVSNKRTLANIAGELLMIEDGNFQQTIMERDTYGIEDAGQLLGDEMARDIGEVLNENDLKTIQNTAARFVRPNLYYNEARTNELRLQAIDAVPRYSATYKKNERIIEANVPVTATHIAALDAYRNEMSTRSLAENRRRYFGVALGKTLIGLGVIAIFAGYLFIYRRRVFESFNRMLLLAFIAAMPLSVAFYAAWSGNVSDYLVPVAIASILTTVLFDAELGLMMSLAVSLIVTTLLPGGTQIGIIYFLAGGMGVLTVGRVRHRRQFYRSMAVVPLVMAVSVLATHDWITFPSPASVGGDVFLAAINGFFSTVIAMGLLPVLESTFRIVTDITLLELSDLNNPLLKEMAVKAPGTFSSVLMVGALAESAAERIGANPLLARVGAYYHDIGKIAIPEYFIENQMGGENPHDRLSPHMSSLVIASHVKEGYELGMRYGLPEAILDIIMQHHGTSLMASIYQKAVESEHNGKVPDEDYRYPGPKPQTREAGIVMLADLVEAASRTLQERAPGRLKTLVNTIIKKRFMDGELDECDITLRDIHNIEESFLPVLVGSHHGRIAYPWQKKLDDQGTAARKKVANVTLIPIATDNPDA